MEEFFLIFMEKIKLSGGLTKKLILGSNYLWGICGCVTQPR